jgi:hypothetical protein
MRIKLLGFVPGVVIGAALFISAPSLASGPATAAYPCDNIGATPFLTITQNITNDPDSGVHGDWATDAFTENVSVWVGSDGVSYCANANTTNGTFVTAGGISPEAGTPLAAGITGNFTGGENYTFASTSGLVLNSDYSSTSTQSITIDDSSTAGFSWWVNQVFPSVASTTGSSYVNTYSLTYVTPNDGTWTDADSGDMGDLGPVVDTNTGTGYATIQAAITAATAGDTIKVAAGTYNENVNINKSLTLQGAQAGVAVAGRTFNSATESTVGAVTDGSGTLTVNAPNVTIDGFSLTDVRTAFSAEAIDVKNPGNNALITNNLIDTVSTADTSGNGTAQGIYLENGPDGVQILANSINNVHSNRSAKGILVGANGDSDAATNAVIENNTITNITSDIKGGYGISFGDATVPHSNVMIENNTISGLTGGGWVHGLGLEGDTTGATITGNTITVSGSNAFAVQYEANAGATTVTFANNNISALSGAKDVDNVATTTAVDVTNNYWGATTTPASLMTGSVTFSPWYTDASMTTLSYTTSSSASNTSATTGSSDTTLEGTSTSSGNVNVTVDIPANTTITGDSSWDGTITPPTATSSSVSVSGFNTSVTAAVEIGSSDSDLTFNNAVKLTFAGEAGQHIGWYNHAGEFTEITDSCDTNATTTTINSGSAFPAAGSCKMDANGDLVVWTKHFSVFVSYTQSAVVSSGNSGGGGGGGGGNGAPVGTIGTTNAVIPTTSGSATTGTTQTTGTQVADNTPTQTTGSGTTQASGGAGEVLGAQGSSNSSTVVGEAASTGPNSTSTEPTTTPTTSDQGAAAATSGFTIPGWAWATLVILIAAGAIGFWLYGKKA